MYSPEELPILEFMEAVIPIIGGLQKSAGSRWESQSFDVKSLKHSENVRCFKINENA